MRAIYVGYEPFGRPDGGRGTTGGRPCSPDAQSLLSRPTYFTESLALRKRVSILEERLSDWMATKEQLKQVTALSTRSPPALGSPLSAPLILIFLLLL